MVNSEAANRTVVMHRIHLCRPLVFVKPMNQEQPRYTLILHQTRKRLGLSLMEYCVADSIYHLSNNPTSKVPGWCFASKETIAEFLSTTDRTVFACISSLIAKRLIEKEETTKHIRTTRT